MTKACFDSKQWSSYPLLTLRENPADAEIASDRFLTRAGVIHKLNAGIFAFLPLGTRILQKIERVIRQEMNLAGAIELQMPILVDGEVWKQSGRWEAMGAELFRLQDRKRHEYLLGPTHEETVTLIMKNLIKSYKHLPVNVYQIQAKFRDEIRPRFAVIRSREFSMKDAYSFHLTADSLHQTYQDMAQCYKRIFERFSIQYMVVSADSSSMGGAQSEEFIIPSPIGEEEYMFTGDAGKNDFRAARTKVLVDWTASGTKKTDLNFWENWSQSMKTKTTLFPIAKNPKYKQLYKKIHIAQPQDSLSLVHTPNVYHIDDLAKFMQCKPEHILKTLIYEYEDSSAKPSQDAEANGKMHYCMACIRGDRQINERTLCEILNTNDISLISEEKTRILFGRFDVNRGSHENPKKLDGKESIHGFIGPLYTLANIQNHQAPAEKQLSSEEGIHLLSLQINRDDDTVDWTAIEIPKMRVVFDRSLTTQKSWLVGCNLPEHHLLHFRLPQQQNDHNIKEFYSDFALANSGDFPAVLKNGLSQAVHTARKPLPLKLIRGIELGHLFKLGRKYTQSLNMQVSNAKGANEVPLMGCYGIGIGRTMAAIIEQNSCEDGFVWPTEIAPFQMILILLAKEESVAQAAKEIFEALSLHTDILWDDRTIQNGVKLNDAELLGIPYQIRIGKSYLKEKKIEWVCRSLCPASAKGDFTKARIACQKIELTGEPSELIAQLQKLFLQTRQTESDHAVPKAANCDPVQAAKGDR